MRVRELDLLFLVDGYLTQVFLKVQFLMNSAKLDTAFSAQVSLPG